MPSIFISTKSETSIVDKFQKMQIHKKRIKIEQLASYLRTIVRELINYYGKFSTGHLQFIWNNLNKRLMKWVQWEKGLYVMVTLKWLWKKYKASPNLFSHWALFHHHGRTPSYYTTFVLATLWIESACGKQEELPNSRARFRLVSDAIVNLNQDYQKMCKLVVGLLSKKVSTFFRNGQTSARKAHRTFLHRTNDRIRN